MRSFRTASSFTSRNKSGKPPPLTLMLYHYSVARAASQGTGTLSGAFAARLARGGSSTSGRRIGLDRCCAGCGLKTGDLNPGNCPAIGFLRENDRHPDAAGIWLFLFCGRFPPQGRHDGFAANELNIFDLSDRLGPARSGEDKSCGFLDARRTNPQVALHVYKLAIRGKHPCKLSCLTEAPYPRNLHHGNNFCRGILEFSLWII